jgi:hypothetical protein
LAEGDATSAMFDVLFATMAPGKSILDMPDDLFVQQVSQSMETGPGSDAPRAMKDGLAAPYVDGVVFVHALRRAGGWAAVDGAWASPPTTTEQVLHPDKFAQHEPALDVPTPTVKALGTGWDATNSDTYGELPLRITYAEWTSDDDARRIASHWGGDRAVLTRNGDQVALAWRVRYDPAPSNADTYAASAFTTASAAMIAKLGPAKLRDTSMVCFERPNHATLSLSRVGRDLLFLTGPAAAADMTPHGDCALAKRWSQEVLGTAPLLQGKK